MSQSKQRCFNTFVDTDQMFSNLNSKTQNQLQSIASTKKIDEGAFLDHTRIYADGVYLIVNGAARASTLDKNGNQLYVSTASSGAIYGLFPVMSKQPDIQVIQAISPITALFLPARKFRKIVHSDRQLCEQVIKFICNRLKYFSDLANRLSFMKPIDRITHCLADIAPVYLRLGEEQSSKIKLTISQYELSGMLALSRQCINEHLKNLEALGLLNIGYKSITILDLPKLRNRNISAN